MSDYFRFICTRTTQVPSIPNANLTPADLIRRLQLIATNIQTTRVGQIMDFPLAIPQPNMLLCDGSEVPKASFPELYAYLGDTQGTPVDSNNFVLPDYEGTATVAAVYPTQTITNGTVSFGGTITTPTNPGQTGGSVGGNVKTGARV